MKHLRYVSQLAGFVLALTGFASHGESTPAVLFTAYATEAKLTLFSLKPTSGDQTAAKWLVLHDEISGYLLKSFDPSTEELVVTRDTEVLRLHPVYSQSRTARFAEPGRSVGPAESSHVLSREEAKAHFDSLVARLLAEAKSLPVYKAYEPQYEQHLSLKFRALIDAARKKAEENGGQLFVMEVRGKPAYYNYVPIEKRYPEALWKNLTADELQNLNIAAAFAGTEWNIALANAGLI